MAIQISSDYYNPINSGLVKEAEHYLYSSAINYSGGLGLIEVELIDIGMTEGYVHI